MKRLTEGTQQTSDDLNVTNAAYSSQLFTAVCSAKHAHYLLSVGDKVGVLLSRWKHAVLIEIDDVVSKKFRL